MMGKLRLRVKRKAHKRARLGLSTGTRQRAEYPRQVWIWDIIQDQRVDGRILKCLTLLDEYTRESFKIRVDYYMTGVLRKVESAFQEYGEPEYIRSDNRSGFIAKIIQDRLKEKQIATLYIPRGPPGRIPILRVSMESLGMNA
jgi:putative transposase